MIQCTHHGGKSNFNPALASTPPFDWVRTAQIPRVVTKTRVYQNCKLR
jgi:hypothetical protein